jgi:hypothetical protein
MPQSLWTKYQAMGGLDIRFCAKASAASMSCAASLTPLLILVSKAIIPYVPTQSPTLGHLVYEMILAYFLAHDPEVSTRHPHRAKIYIPNII